MPIEYRAGQLLTADDLQHLAPARYRQGVDQAVASSITPVDTSIVIPVDDLIQIDLRARYTSLAGGIRWDWNVSSGSVTCNWRAILSAGQTTSGTTATIADMRHRAIATLAEDQTTEHYTTNTSQFIWEELELEGSGTVVFRFAQQTSNASATTLHSSSYATVRRLALAS